jgi:hypothetical protein
LESADIEKEMAQRIDINENNQPLFTTERAKGATSKDARKKDIEDQ